MYSGTDCQTETNCAHIREDRLDNQLLSNDSASTRAVRIGLTVLIMGALADATNGQSHPDWPVEDIRTHRIDTGQLNNPLAVFANVYQETIHFADSAWVRLYFGNVILEKGSFIRITSMLDHEVQELDADALNMWQHSSAYFNGDKVLVELIAEGRTSSNRLIIERIARAKSHVQPVGQAGECGICGADNRVQSNEQWSARLFPAGCTASIFSEDGCMVSAGHCVDGTTGDVVQFNVPNSNSNCFTNNPPIADQFPVTSKQFVNAGVGNDWSVLTTGTNNLGQTIFQRYGVLRPIATAPASIGQAIDVWGYGVDTTCTLSQVQQHNNGSISSVFGSFYEVNVDITGGNSGSAVIHNGQIIGIITHCPCPNVATRIDLPSFASAIAQVCQGGGGNPACPGTGDCFVANGTPGCSNETCCETVCACDPFCCDSQWDEFCAGNGVNDNGCGAAALCVAPGPANDNCSNATLIGEGNFAFDTTDANTDGPALPVSCEEGFGLTLVNDVWFRYTPACSGSATISLCTSAYDTRMAVYDNNVCPGGLLACNDDSCGTGGLRSEITLNVIIGSQYLIRVGGFDTGGAGSLTINCTASTCNADCAVPSDGLINITDLLKVLGDWGQALSFCNVNGDNTVDVTDLLTILGAWGVCP